MPSPLRLLQKFLHCGRSSVKSSLCSSDPQNLQSLHDLRLRSPSPVPDKNPRKYNVLGTVKSYPSEFERCHVIRRETTGDDKRHHRPTNGVRPHRSRLIKKIISQGFHEARKNPLHRPTHTGLEQTGKAMTKLNFTAVFLCGLPASHYSDRGIQIQNEKYVGDTQ